VAEKRKVIPIADEALYLFDASREMADQQKLDRPLSVPGLRIPNDRVRAFALWEGWFGYDSKKYAAMVREAFEPFVQCAPKAGDIKCPNEPFS
jgi:hypothetical protein